MKVFISADIEGVNGIVNWDETDMEKGDYAYFQKQMTNEVKFAAMGAHEAGASDILIKDAHDSARNLIFSELPNYVRLHRGWEGSPASMMAGLDKSFDGVIFIGYHSASDNSGNPLAHTMNTQNVYVKINGEKVSEFDINAMYAACLGVPVIFLSGDEALCNHVKEYNPDAEVVVTKTGRGGAVISRHPEVTNQLIMEGVKEVLTRNALPKVVKLPQNFKLEIKYRRAQSALSASFYPGCVLKEGNVVEFNSNDYYEVLRAIKFIL